MAIARIATSGLFDLLYYREENPDLELADRELVGHFVRQGSRQGRRPCAWFDPHWYLEAYPDVAAAEIDPFAHFVGTGMFEARKPAPEPPAARTLPALAPSRSGVGMPEPMLPAPAARRVRQVVFVSHTPFDSNSSGHIAYFANGLAALGYDVAVVAPGSIAKALTYGEPAYAYFSLEDFAARPDLVFGRNLTMPQSVRLISWSPREIVRRVVEPVAARYGLPFVVHLEDNEAHLAQSYAGVGPARAEADEFWAHPERASAFLAGAAGITGITARLAELSPPGRPFMILRPGVDAALFDHSTDERQRAVLRQALGVPPTATLLAYCGNVHRANACEVATLYNAVAIVRARGRDVRLVRTGTDTVRELMFPAELRTMEGVLPLGFVDRPFLAALVRSADLFVQPGAPGPFNDYRVPSKLPEFLATGRPVILPRTNIGLDLEHGENALLLDTGAPTEIAERLEDLLADPERASRIGAGGRAFARERLRWDVQSARLAAFLEAVGAEPA